MEVCYFFINSVNNNKSRKIFCPKIWFCPYWLYEEKNVPLYKEGTKMQNTNEIMLQPVIQMKKAEAFL